MYTTIVMGIDSFRLICEFAAYACAAGVGVCAIGVGAYWIAKKLARSARQIAAVSLVGVVLIGGMVVVGTDDVGTKSGTNDVMQVEGGTNTTQQTQVGTNNVGQTDGDLTGTNGTGGVGGPLMLGLFGRLNLGQTLSSVTDEDIAKGWRVFLVVSNNNATAADAFAFSNANDACASVWEAAQRHGAVYGHWALPLDEWLFPFGDSGWTHPFLRCEGVLRDSFREDVNQIRFLAPFALCPAANWPRYNLSASRAWCATNDLGCLTVAVENGALGNDPAQIACTRIDLDPSLGEIRLRYDLSRIGETTFDVGPTLNGTNTFVTVGSNTSEVVFRRVHPDDWDFDGLPNALDPSPRLPDADAGWNQGDAWAMLAFPSNAAEIASMGYAAWAAARAAEPNRLLLGLEFASSKSVWPVCLTFGDVQVMCDGTQEIVFPIDRGAHYPFSVSGGELVGARVVDTWWFADFFPDLWFVPYDRQVGNLTVHLDSPGSGWVGTTAEVSVDGLDGAHFFSDESRVVTAVVTNCHEDAYIDCTWFGGEGVTFSNRHSLETVITWQTTNSVAWTTNMVTLVTTYVGGYSVTNGYVVTIGTQLEPTPTLSVSCPAVQFLNDGIGGDRLERYYPVTFRLLGAPGTGGAVNVSFDGQTQSSLFWDSAGDTPYDRSRLELEVPLEGGYTDGGVLYMKSAHVGEGSLTVTMTLTNGTPLSCSVPFRVIEPIRRFITNDRYQPTRQIVNPPCLVLGTNAVLKVSALGAGSGEGGFSPLEIAWSVVTGNVQRLETVVGNDGASYAIVEPLDAREDVVIEARFNDDAIQPRFRLPVVSPRVIPVRAFVVEPPFGPDRETPWEQGDIVSQIEIANDVFSQIGVSFKLLSVSNIVDREDFWDLEVETDSLGNVISGGAIQQLVDTYDRGDCVELYYTGRFSDSDVLAFRLPEGVVLSRSAVDTVLAHELGHVFGLSDAYYWLDKRGWLDCSSEPVRRSTFVDTRGEDPSFPYLILDWGNETGRGFYAADDTVERSIGKLLMHGHHAAGQIDIPGGFVISLDNHSPTNQSVYVPVGIDVIEQKNEEVLSK